MTYDELPELKVFIKQTIGFPLLRDEQARHVNLFQVRDLGYQKDSGAYGIPYPGIFGLPQTAGSKQVRGSRFSRPPPLNEVYDEIRELPDQTKKF